VAGIAEALLGAQGNIEDSQMSILRGHFAVMLIVAVPDSVDRDQLARRLEPVRDRLGLEALAIDEVDDVDPARPQASHVITVYGSDHPGIVHAVSAALAELEVNITDLQTRLTGAGDEALYLLLMEVALGDADPARVQSELDAVSSDARVEIGMRPLDAEAL
jgi:glycine cleavage system transcriptional repressor